MRQKHPFYLLITILTMHFLPMALFGQTTIAITDTTRTYSSLTNTIINMSGKSELHLTAAVPLSNSHINLNSTDSWIFFEYVKPSAIVANYLTQVKVNGANAVNGNNVRVTQYTNGAVVIPHSSSYIPLQIYDGTFCSGNSRNLNLYTYYKSSTLGSLNNAISSFKLKRGYMATFAQDENGLGKSKVYIAQDCDIIINIMPDELNDSVSFVRVFPWRWVNKKGYSGGDPAAYNALEASWFYDWDNATNSTIDSEYIPMRHNLNWNAYANINNKQNSTAALGFNEPDSSSQAGMSVDTAIEQWPNLLASGLRIGSPATTDGGLNWLYDFIDRADELDYRVDFVAVHFYTCGKSASQLYNWLKAIHDRTGRPIWVTEFNNGANWTDCSDPTLASNAITIQEFIDIMDSAPFVERYAIYNWVEDVRYVINNDYSLTPAGINYRDNDAPIALRQPVYEGSQGCAHYTFDKNTNDSLAYSNHAIAYGNRSYATGKNSYAINLDGTDDYVEIPANLCDCDDFTFAAWIYWDGSNQWQRIFDFGSDSTYYMLLTPRSDSNTLRFAITTTSYHSEQRLDTTQLATGQWVHIAVTIKANTGRLYVNGSQVAINTNMTINPSDLHPASNYLGKSHFASDPYFNGRIDEVHIANYALSGAEISELFSGIADGYAPGFTGDTFTAEPARVMAPYKSSLYHHVGDFDNSTGDMTFNKISGPEWLSIDSNGDISGTPDLFNADINSFQVQVTDYDNNSSQAILQVPVDRFQIIAHYKMEGNLNDETNSNTLTAFGEPEYSTGKIGQALVFDGTNDYLKLPTGISYQNNFMFAAWVYWNGGSQWQRILDIGNGITHYMLLTPSSGGNTLRLAITNSGGGGEKRIDTTQMPTGQWVHIAIVVSDSTINLYVDGNLAGTIANTGLTLSDVYANCSYIGKSQFAADPLFNGMIDDIRIYNYSIGSAAAQKLPVALSNNAPWFIRNPVPAIDAIEDSSYVGYNVNYSARELDVDNLTFYKVSGPEWLNINTNGSISGTPSDADTGLNEFVIEARDESGLSGVTNLRFEVKNIYSGVNGLEDFAGIASQWLTDNCTDTPACNGADLDNSGSVDMADISKMIEKWLESN